MKVLKNKEIYILFVIIFFTIIITSFNRSFFSFENVSDILKTISIPGILAMGVFVAVLSGGVDISFGAIATVAMFIAGKFMTVYGGNIFTSFLIGTTVGMILGAVNGVLVSKLKIPTIIVTLGTLSIFRSSLFLITGGVWIYELPEWFIEFGRIYILGIPIQAYFYIVVIIVTLLILKYTTLGRGIYAIGGSQESAFRIGFNIFKIQMFIYIYIGLIAGIAGVLNITIAEVVDPRSFTGIEFPVIAAVVLGGASIQGGTGTVFGTVLGSLFVAIMNRGLILTRVSSFWHEIIIGLLIMISISIDAIQRRYIESKRIRVSFD
ncbi:MAG: ABC transporter permease [Actinobacteria bacterium]|nr:ABC transporter permease [Actinomycetota bacterium]